MDFNDTKEFYDPRYSMIQKGISIGSTDFDNLKVYSDTSIFDGLVEIFSSEFLWCKSLGVIDSTGTFHCLGFCSLEIGFAS